LPRAVIAEPSAKTSAWTLESAAEAGVLIAPADRAIDQECV
jgi:hypothetical protein